MTGTTPQAKIGSQAILRAAYWLTFLSVFAAAFFLEHCNKALILVLLIGACGIIRTVDGVIWMGRAAEGDVAPKAWVAQISLFLLLGLVMAVLYMFSGEGELLRLLRPADPSRCE